MKKIKTDSQQLNDFLSSLSHNEKRVVIDNLCAGCLVPRYTIHNWARGLARIPALHKCKIEEIIGHEIFDKELLS